MFDYLSLSCVIDDKIFCVHGGLSPSIHSIDQIKIIDRFREIPHEGPMADLVWSDPDAERDEFSLSPRGAGYQFGAQVVKKFLEVNNMNHILRAHQLCNEGHQTTATAAATKPASWKLDPAGSDGGMYLMRRRRMKSIVWKPSNSNSTRAAIPSGTTFCKFRDELQVRGI